MRGRWCNIIVLNVHAPSEEKSDESKDSFYEELEQVFDHLPKYHMKILLGDFNLMRGEVCTGFWLGNLRERDHWGDPDVDGRIILRWIFRKWEGVVGNGWSWLRIGAGGGCLWVR